jgi:hypothetical protein
MKRSRFTEEQVVAILREEGAGNKAIRNLSRCRLHACPECSGFLLDRPLAFEASRLHPALSASPSRNPKAACNGETFLRFLAVFLRRRVCVPNQVRHLSSGF